MTPPRTGCRAPRVLGATALLWAMAAPSPAEEAPSAWVELDAPPPVVTPAVALTEVRGRAGVGTLRGHDLVVALDVSASTWIASGVDVDGDGRVGRPSRQLRLYRERNIQTPSLERTDYSSDPDDSVAAALAAGAEGLLERLDLAHTRVGLLAFAEVPRRLAPLGAPPDALAAALDALGRRPGGGGTDLGAAIREATALFASEEAAGRQRTLILLSDGRPSLPAPPRAAAASSLEAAAAARDAGVRILAFALGPEREGLRLFERVAYVTGGALVRVVEPGEILVELPRVDLARIAEVGVTNASSGAEGRAVRLFPDGRFDGFVTLVPGENRIRVEVRDAAGRTAAAERRVRYAPPDSDDPGTAARQQRELEELLEVLRARTAGTELLLQVEEARRAHQERQLRLEPGEGAPPQKP